MDATIAIDVRYYRLSEPLQPYFTALYGFEFDCPPDRAIEDHLHPEWSQMRFFKGAPPHASIGPGPLREQWPFVASGPTSRSIRFALRAGRVWGLGLKPAGWARFAHGPAQAIADQTVDGSTHPAFTLFAPIQRMVEQEDMDLDSMAVRINDYLMTRTNRPPANPLISDCHEALRDPEIASVSQLGERLGLAARSLERFCGQHFGFPPKLLLRRQRFLRSLAEFMLNSHRSWSEALDGQYHDQAQFVRDFRAFMGMTPSEYAEMPHPILDRIIAQRMADQGAAPQTDLPTLLRYTARPPHAD